MQYCSKCGAELDDNAMFCSVCGAKTRKNTVNVDVQDDNRRILALIAKAFMIVSCIAFAVTIIPLGWMIPMTITYSNRIKDGDKVSLVFAICTLIFVNPISGVLMLVDYKNLDF